MRAQPVGRGAPSETEPLKWLRPAGRTLRAVALAIAGFAAAWVGLHHGFYRDGQLVDTPTYESYGEAIAHGRVPYRDFGLEYPPAALPVFAIPAYISPHAGDLASYQRGFEAEMFVCGALALLLMAVTLVRLDAGPRRIELALGFAAVTPLLIGSVMLSRFDLWPAALTIASLAALVSGRYRLSVAVLGVVFAAKIYPAVLLPVALAWVWKRHGRREAAVGLGVFAAVALACVLPFVVVAPHGFWDALTRQTNRPLQIETLGAGVLLVAHAVAGFPITMRTAYGPRTSWAAWRMCCPSSRPSSNWWRSLPSWSGLPAGPRHPTVWCAPGRLPSARSSHSGKCSRRNS